MMESKPLLTVIVPAYNVENYLGDCLDSIMGQTQMDHKVIVVNDGSTDDTGKIAQRYADKYPDRVQCITQENQGLGAARNTGLARVDTEYVTFLDSDDWWDCLFIEKLKQELAGHEGRPDIVFSLPWIYDSISKRCLPWYDKDRLEEIFYPDADDGNGLSRELNIHTEPELYMLEPSACRRIYRRQFLEDLQFRFPVGVKWEDVQPHFYLTHRASCCIGLRDTGFLYRINTGSQTTATTGASRLDIIPVYRETLQMAYAENWAKEEVAYILRMLCSFTIWSIDVTNAEYIDPLVKQLRQLFRSVPKAYFRVYFKLCSPRPKKERVFFWILRSPFYGLLKDPGIRRIGSNAIVWVRKMRGKWSKR